MSDGPISRPAVTGSSSTCNLYELKGGPIGLGFRRTRSPRHIEGNGQRRTNTSSDEKLSVALFPAEGGGVAELLNVSSET